MSLACVGLSCVLFCGSEFRAAGLAFGTPKNGDPRAKVAGNFSFSLQGSFRRKRVFPVLVNFRPTG